LAGDLVSIIIPVKNRFDWFNECLESVFAQDYDNLEIIVVDDASDRSVETFVQQTWPDITSKITFVRNSKSLGPGQAREAGRLLARGAYINYLDSDDLIHPQKIRKQVAFLNTHLDYGMCYCKSDKFFELPLNGTEYIYRDIKLSNSEILPQLFIMRPWGTSCCLWTKKATDLIGAWSIFKAGEDQEYEFRAGMLHIKAYQLPEVLCHIRRSDKDTQLRQNPDLCKNEDAKMFISIAERIRDKKLVDEKTLFLICRNLFTSNIYFLENRDKKSAINCLKPIMRLQSEGKFVSFILLLMILMIKLLPAKAVYHLLFTLRYRIIHLLEGK